MNVTISRRIYDLLIDMDMSVTQLSKITGISRSKLSMIKNDYVDSGNGKPRELNPDEILAITKALNVSPTYLLTGYEDCNQTVCEDLGLSNETIKQLKKYNKITEGLKWKYVQEAIDIIVSDPPIIPLLLCAYFHAEYHEMQGTDDNGRYFSMKPVDFDAIDRLKIMEAIKEVRDNFREGKKNETGKR